MTDSVDHSVLKPFGSHNPKLCFVQSYRVFSLSKYSILARHCEETTTRRTSALKTICCLNSNVGFTNRIHFGRTLIAAAVGSADPYKVSQRSCSERQNVSARFMSGLYISIMSNPAENIVGSVEVSIIPRHLLFSSSSILYFNSCINSKFRLFTGALFIDTVAMPALQSMSLILILPECVYTLNRYGKWKKIVFVYSVYYIPVLSFTSISTNLAVAAEYRLANGIASPLLAIIFLNAAMTRNKL